MRELNFRSEGGDPPWQIEREPDGPALLQIGTALDDLIGYVRSVGRDSIETGRGSTAEYDDLARVTTMIAARRARTRSFPADWFSDPAWDILLFLYQAYLRHQEVGVGDVSAGTDNRPTTTIRWLDVIEAAGMIKRRRCTSDTRRVFIDLDDRGIDAIQGYFDAIR